MNRLHNLLTFFIAVTFKVTAHGHKLVFSEIWSFLRSNSYFYFILRGAFGFAMDIPTTEESGMRRWRYFCESTFSLQSFQVFLLSFERLSGHLFPLSDLFSNYYIRMIRFYQRSISLYAVYFALRL